jgi:mercuric ion transport protein
MRPDYKVVALSILTAISASLCCITPVLALIAGTSGLASTFSWIQPFRPYLIGLTALALAFAWYQNLKPKKKADCDCETDERKRFFFSKRFLGLVTIFAAFMLAFPNYAHIFYPETGKQIVTGERSNIITVEFKITGMTCSSCAEHVDYELNKVSGVLKSEASYENGNAIVQFDKSKTNLDQMEISINSTGYRVTDKHLK